MGNVIEELGITWAELHQTLMDYDMGMCDQWYAHASQHTSLRVALETTPLRGLADPGDPTSALSPRAAGTAWGVRFWAACRGRDLCEFPRHIGPVAEGSLEPELIDRIVAAAVERFGR